MTIMSSSSVLPPELFGKEIEFSKQELKAHCETGLITRIDNHKEHYAIQPCWIHDPGRGVMEEINGTVLGKWNAKLKSYVVHVDNVRNNDLTAGMNEDHRWLHIDVIATFHTYTPEVGQRLKGEIKKVGSKAAICMLFDVFTATVLAHDETELNSWSEGDELQFEIHSFIHRRKGPIIRAKTIVQHIGKSKGKKRKFSDLQDSMEQDKQTELLENGYDPDETMPFPETEPTKSKKKKKHKRIKLEPDDSFEGVGESSNVNVNNTSRENEDFTHGYHNELDETQEINTDTEKIKKKKKKKHKKIKQKPEEDSFEGVCESNVNTSGENEHFTEGYHNELDETQEINADAETSKKKKKKKKKRSSHNEED